MWCSVAATVATSRVRSRLTGGPGGRSRLPARMRSLRMVCATLAGVSRSVPGSMCLRCNGCLDTTRPRSRWTPTRTCLTTIWTQFRPRYRRGIRPKMWAKCGHRAGSMVHSRPENRAHLHRRSLSISAGGGIRTLTLFRAMAPKAIMSAVPSRPQRCRSYRLDHAATCRRHRLA
jgi:hypothetical protein